MLKNIIERAADPRDFLDDPDRLPEVIDYLNARLAYDGLELLRVGERVCLSVNDHSNGTPFLHPKGPPLLSA